MLDRRQRRVVLGRDALGDRSLCYFLDRDLLVVASEESAVLRHPRVGRRLDEERIVLFLALEELVDGSTFFRDVRELLPAHVMTVGERDSRTTRYWDVPEAPRVARGAGGRRRRTPSASATSSTGASPAACAPAAGRP